MKRPGWLDLLDSRNLAEVQKQAAERAATEAAGELTALGDRIARAIIADAIAHTPRNPRAAAERYAGVARRVAAETVVTLPGHTAPDPARRRRGRHASQHDLGKR